MQKDVSCMRQVHLKQAPIYDKLNPHWSRMQNSNKYGTLFKKILSSLAHKLGHQEKLISISTRGILGCAVCGELFV